MRTLEQVYLRSRFERDSYLANSSLSSRTSSSAVHWSDRLVKPQMSAKRMLCNNTNDSFLYRMSLKIQISSKLFLPDILVPLDIDLVEHGVLWFASDIRFHLHGDVPFFFPENFKELMTHHLRQKKPTTITYLGRTDSSSLSCEICISKINKNRMEHFDVITCCWFSRWMLMRASIHWRVSIKAWRWATSHG